MKHFFIFLLIVFSFSLSEASQIFWVGEGDPEETVDTGGVDINYYDQAVGCPSCEQGVTCRTQYTYFSNGYIAECQEYDGGWITTSAVGVIYDVTGENWSTVEPIPDQDNDGIPDNFDPYPDDEKDFTWRWVADGKDASGEIVWGLIEVDGEKYIEVGDESLIDGYPVFNITSTHHDQADFAGLFGTGTGSGSVSSSVNSSSPSSGVNVGQTPTDYTATDIETGSDNTDNSIDTDYLTDIVTNTNKALTNDQRIADLLESIRHEIHDQTKVGIIQPSAVSGDTSNDVSSQDIADAIKANEDAQAIEDQAESDNISNNLGDNDYGNGFIASDAPEKNFFSGIMDSFLSNNPVSTYFSDSGILATGDCSLSFDFKGNPVELTMCQYAEPLQVWGAVMLSFTSLLSLLIIFKR